MLNKDNVRELAYIVEINGIVPIEGADRVELAIVNGWTVMVRKNQFKTGDLAIYFEIDSKVPEVEPFMFLKDKHFKIKTQKYFKGKVLSQGLLMSAEDFGWKLYQDGDGTLYIHDNDRNESMPEGTFLTNRLGVVYAVAEDNKRKAATANKYAKMAQRNKKLFNKEPFKTLMKHELGRKILFVFFGKKKDKRGWPEWVKKTDEERVQNMPWILQDKNPWIATEKIDGTSTTFTMKRNSFGRYSFYICSRNVVFDNPEKECFYDTNVYVEMAKKYDIENVLKNILDSDKNLAWATIQGETYGAGIQNRDYGMKDHDFKAFNFITSADGRWNSIKAKELMETYGISWVPIIDEHFILPDTVEELLQIATGNSVVDGGMREGLVFRSLDGARSFKAVSNEFLLKYHNG